MVCDYQNGLALHTQGLARCQSDDANALSLQRFLARAGDVGRRVVGVAGDEVLARHVDGLVSVAYASPMKPSATDDIYIQLYGAPIAARSGAREVIDDAGGGVVADTANGNQTESVCNIVVA